MTTNDKDAEQMLLNIEAANLLEWFATYTPKVMRGGEREKAHAIEIAKRLRSELAKDQGELVVAVWGRLQEISLESMAKNHATSGCLLISKENLRAALEKTKEQQ